MFLKRVEFYGYSVWSVVKRPAGVSTQPIYARTYEVVLLIHGKTWKQPQSVCLQHSVLSKWSQLNQYLLQLWHQQLRCALSRQTATPVLDWQILQHKGTRWQMESKPAFPLQRSAASAFLKCWQLSNGASFCLLFLQNNEQVYQGWIVAGQEQLVSETSEKWTYKYAHTCTQMAEAFNRGFDVQIECWPVISPGCNITADNIYLKGAVDW